MWSGELPFGSFPFWLFGVNKGAHEKNHGVSTILQIAVTHEIYIAIHPNISDHVCNLNLAFRKSIFIIKEA